MGPDKRPCWAAKHADWGSSPNLPVLYPAKVGRPLKPLQSKGRTDANLRRSKQPESGPFGPGIGDCIQHNCRIRALPPTSVLPHPIPPTHHSESPCAGQTWTAHRQLACTCPWCLCQQRCSWGTTYPRLLSPNTFAPPALLPPPAFLLLEGCITRKLHGYRYSAPQNSWGNDMLLQGKVVPHETEHCSAPLNVWEMRHCCALCPAGKQMYFSPTWPLSCWVLQQPKIAKEVAKQIGTLS